MIKISRVAWRVSNINVVLSQVVQKCYSFYCPIWASRISAAWPTAMVLTILLWSGPDNCCSLISLSKDGLSNGGLAVIDKLPSFLSVGMQYNSNQFHLILQQYSIASRGCRTFSTKRFPFVEIVNAPENVHVLLETEPCISNPMYHQHFPGTLVYRLDFWMIYFLFPFAFYWHCIWDYGRILSIKLPFRLQNGMQSLHFNNCACTRMLAQDQQWKQECCCVRPHCWQATMSEEHVL